MQQVQHRLGGTLAIITFKADHKIAPFRFNRSLRAEYPTAYLSIIKSVPFFVKAIPHHSKCRYGERGAAAAKPKAQIILDVLSSILATQMPCRSCRSGA
ncbi:MAG: hypothetical protein WAY39_05460 [Gemmiger qucibialis]